MHPQLLDRLVAPASHLLVVYDEQRASLDCAANGEQFPVRDGIPIMLSAAPQPAAAIGHAGDLADYRAHYELDSEVFDHFETHTGGWEHEERRVHEFALATIPPSAKTVLDVGCGRAWVAKYCLPKGMFVCSQDISLRNVHEALRRYSSPNHCGVVADAFALPFCDGAFDCVIASEIIEHVVDPAAFVRELIRVTAPGGTLIITTPYKEVIHMQLCIHCNQLTPANAHLHSFDETTLRRFATEHTTPRHTTFGNKALLILRTHHFLKYVPFPLWRMIDAAMNFIVSAPAHIIVSYTKLLREPL